MSDREFRPLRRKIQMVFQDPHASLNPAMDLETALAHPLRIHGVADREETHRLVCDALERVGLSPVERFLSKLPGDLSGGQKQRAVIARAIILGPDLLVADEPVSMLDMSVRAKILELMLDLKRDLDLTYVYITHDLATAKFFCDRVAIMYLGRVVEIGPTAEIFAAPKHPYTKALLAAIPEPDPERALPRDLPRGEIPDAAQPPTGCSFHPRCPVAFDRCGWEARDLRAVLENHWVSVDAEVYERERAVAGHARGHRRSRRARQAAAGERTHRRRRARGAGPAPRSRPRRADVAGRAPHRRRRLDRHRALHAGRGPGPARRRRRRGGLPALRRVSGPGLRPVPTR